MQNATYLQRKLNAIQNQLNTLEYFNTSRYNRLIKEQRDLLSAIDRNAFNVTTHKDKKGNYKFKVQEVQHDS
jgi:hypothetical protein